MDSRWTIGGSSYCAFFNILMSRWCTIGAPDLFRDGSLLIGVSAFRLRVTLGRTAVALAEAVTGALSRSG